MPLGCKKGSEKIFSAFVDHKLAFGTVNKTMLL